MISRPFRYLFIKRKLDTKQCLDRIETKGFDDVVTQNDLHINRTGIDSYRISLGTQWFVLWRLLCEIEMLCDLATVSPLHETAMIIFILT